MRNIFRKESLERLQSPDRLDQLLFVVKPQAWLLLATVTLLCSVAVAWSILGQIPITINGAGVLIHPGNVKAVQSDVSGQIIELSIRVGETVAAGDVIARVRQPALQQRLEQAQQQLAESIRFDEKSIQLENAQLAMQRENANERLTTLSEEIKRSTALNAEAKDAILQHAVRQRKQLEIARDSQANLNTALRDRVATIVQLREEGLAAEDSLIGARTNLLQNELSVGKIDLQVREVELQQVQQQQTELQAAMRLSDLQLRLDEIPQQLMQTEAQITLQQAKRKLEILSGERRIEQIRTQLEEQSTIRSPHSGTVLELSASPGQLLNLGTRIATVDVEDSQAELKNLAYFVLKDGKQIQQGDKIYITPSTVARERYGSMIGTVTDITAFPITPEGALNEIGSQEIVRTLLAQGAAIEVEAELETDTSNATGYKWTSKGPDIRLSPGTTTTVRAVIEQRRPITYVIPLLRTWLLGQKDDKKQA